MSVITAITLTGMKNFYLTLIISIVTVINPILCAKAEGVKYSTLPIGAPVDESYTTVLSVNTEFVNNFTLPICAPVDESCTNGNKGEETFGIEIFSEASENTTTIIDKNKKPTTKTKKTNTDSKQDRSLFDYCDHPF